MLVYKLNTIVHEITWKQIMLLRTDLGKNRFATS